MASRLSGKVAVITGAAGGIGQAIAERFAAEGANIAVADRQAADETGRLVQAHGVKFLGLTCDVSDQQAVERFAEKVRAEMGRVDILYNNAAIIGKAPFEELAFETWKSFFAVNLDGYFLMAKAFLPDLKKSGAGRIINMTSTSVWVGMPNMVHYITTKAAIMGFTNSLATELGAHGITVNAIAPSIVRTRTTEGLEPEAVFSMLAGMQALNRTQQPQDLTGAALFLASADAGFITGQTIVVDGGMTRR